MDDDFLRKCLNGETENANELFYQFLWGKCPKTIFAFITFILTLDSF